MFMRMLMAISSLLLCPVLQVGAIDPPGAIIRGSCDPFLAHEVNLTDGSLYEEQQFTQRFNKLVSALQSFSDTYNSGHIIDVQRVKAIKKAWRELGKSDWFRPEKAD
jgi:hypothetical protein